MTTLQNTFLSIYFCDSEDCAPGHSFGPAVRPHYLLHVIRSGSGSFCSGGNTYPLKTGDAFLIKPLESTFYQASQTDPWCYSWIGFDGPAAETLLASTCFSQSCVFSGDTDTLQQLGFFSLLARLLDTWRTTGTNSYALTGMFLELLEFMRTEPAAAAPDYAGGYLQKAKDYINRNYSYPIKVTDIAQAVGIDRTYLYRIFMEEEKLSPKQYLTSLRLRTSLTLLCTTSYSITEIAYYCGFGDSAAFCNQFKAQFSQSPGSFRKEAGVR